MLRLTHNYSWNLFSEAEQKQKFGEFAEAGARYLVLGSNLLGEGLKSTAVLLNFHRRMKEFGLDFLDAHALWGTWEDPGMPLEEWHEAVILRHRLSIRLCSAFGVNTLTFHTGNTFNSIFGRNLTLEDYRRMLIRSLEELLPEAEKQGVILALENQWTPLNHSSQLLGIMKYFNSPSLGLCYDTGHGNLMEKGMLFPGKTCVPPIWDDLGVPVEWEENLLEKFLPWLVNCHLHDNDGIHDEHKLPGDGTVDWARIRTALNNAPRLQCIQNESASHNITIRQSCQKFDSLLNDRS